jgi:hypothetical protein
VVSERDSLEYYPNDCDTIIFINLRAVPLPEILAGRVGDIGEKADVGKIARLMHRQRRSNIPPGRNQRMRRLPMVVPWIMLIGMAAAVYVLSDRFIAGQPRFASCGWILWRNCVVDGDTIHYAGRKIRLLDINAPEISNPGCPSELALGLHAKKRLIELMNAGPVEVIRAGGNDTDAYGRDLRVVTVGGKPVADQLIAEGLARRWGDGPRGWCD